MASNWTISMWVGKINGISLTKDKTDELGVFRFLVSELHTKQNSEI